MDTRGRPEMHDDSNRARGPVNAPKYMQIHVIKYKYIKLPSRPQEKAATKVLGKEREVRRLTLSELGLAKHPSIVDKANDTVKIHVGVKFINFVIQFTYNNKDYYCK
jgi:hypothetical protein